MRKTTRGSSPESVFDSVDCRALKKLLGKHYGRLAPRLMNLVCVTHDLLKKEPEFKQRNRAWNADRKRAADRLQRRLEQTQKELQECHGALREAVSFEFLEPNTIGSFASLYTRYGLFVDAEVTVTSLQKDCAKWREQVTRPKGRPRRDDPKDVPQVMVADFVAKILAPNGIKLGRSSYSVWAKTLNIVYTAIYRPNDSQVPKDPFSMISAAYPGVIESLQQGIDSGLLNLSDLHEDLHKELHLKAPSPSIKRKRQRKKV
jgi:hypothetical protein